MYNRGLYQNAYLIIGIFLTTFVVMLMVMSFGAGISVRKAFWSVLISNLVIFGVIGAVEYTFFDLVARKYVPIAPSSITENIINSIKNQFPTQ